MNWLTRFAALGLLVCSSTAHGAPHPLVQMAAVGMGSVGQQTTRASVETRREVDRLLSQARKAMQQGRLDQAEQYIVQAEKFHLKYDLFRAPFQYTPARARKELEKQKRIRRASPPARSSRRLASQSTATGHAGPPPVDPFTAHNRRSAPTRISGTSGTDRPPAALAAQDAVHQTAGPPHRRAQNASAGPSDPTPHSQANRTAAGLSPRRRKESAGPADRPTARSAPPPPDGPPADRDEPSGAQWLLEARRALARGDVPSAARWTAKARSAGPGRSPLGDSPEKVDSLIRRFHALQTTPQPKDPAAFSKDHARLLLQQADWLIQYRQYDLAERLARDAQRTHATFGPFERTPDQLLAEIAQQRPPADVARPPTPARTPPAPGQARPAPTASPAPSRKAQSLQLVAQAQRALDHGDVQAAQAYIRQAVELNVPDHQFAPDEMRPWELMLQIDRAAAHRAQGAAGAGTAASANRLASRPADYQPGGQPTGNGKPGLRPPTTAPDLSPPPDARESEAQRLYREGIEALKRRDRQTALKDFRQAWQHQAELDERTRQLVQEKLDLLQAAGRQPPRPLPDGRSPLKEVLDQRQLAVQKLQQEIFRQRAAAEGMKRKDPRGALQKLRDLRDRVAEAEIDPAMRKHLLTLVDRSVLDMQRYIEQNLAQIENDERNKARIEQVQANRRRAVEIDSKLAQLVDDFNQLIDENRFAEAEVIARQARELDPDNPVVQNLIWKSRFARRLQAQLAIQEQKEENFVRVLGNVERASIPFDDEIPLQYGDATKWKELSRTRGDWLHQRRHRLTAEELKIQQALTTEKVNVRFANQPLREVMEILGASAGVNIHLDPRGLHAEAITSDTPVTLNLNQAISLKSALNLILEPMGLSYVVQNEVIKVTSRQLRDENVFARTYYVADLVIPIPNFVPSYNMGLPGAIAHAQNSLGYGGSVPPSGTVPLTVAMNQDVTNPVTTNPKVLANLGPNGLVGSARSPRPLGYGPGGLGGGVVADFDSLIDLITTTIAPESWDEVGGPGTISEFETNLSLVISQTQEVHEQIADLLEQLRRLQDLQVTIEVRFVTLQDNFFERIGVDFDFEIRDKTGLAPGATVPEVGTFIVGNTLPNGTPTADFDIPFSQDSFASAVPQFGGFDAATAANFGFAILSDIEAFFLLQASTGDSRTNVMQAPKVTLFNGQFATISDITQQPFVTSVIPVVGDFAAAHQPVIVVLSEGSSLTMQAVVSADRRFVRLTLVPFFSSIGDVQEFTFNGKKTAKTTTNVVDSNGNPTGATDTTSDVIEGTTVQLPQFSFTTVTTTVSVPDGGTVLLGGIKRLSEGRTERGVPLMSKLPYINRLFKNVGIGREAESLMFMVTPRIIIQEEEELEQTGLESSKL